MEKPIELWTLEHFWTYKTTNMSPVAAVSKSFSAFCSEKINMDFILP
jgi:hypothetical protein